MAWFRSHDGAPQDDKWTSAAKLLPRKLKIGPDTVAAVAWKLLECANMADDRGSIADFNPRNYALWCDRPVEHIKAVVTALYEVGFLAAGRIQAWEKRQPLREREPEEAGASTERSARSRAKKKAIIPAKDTATMQRNATACNSPNSNSNSDTGQSQSSLSLIPPSVEGGRGEGEREREIFTLECECRTLVEGEPVSVNINFRPIQRLVNAGLAPGDVREGVRRAVATGMRPRSWSAFENFIRRAAKDRLERAGPGGGDVLRFDQARSARGRWPAPRNYRLEALAKLHAELNGLPENVSFAREADDGA